MSSKTEYESYLTGVGEERERIINLLLTEITEGENATSVAGLYQAIALIKGEK